MELNEVEKAAQAKMAPTVAKIGTEPYYVLPQISIMVNGKSHLVKTAFWLERAGMVAVPGTVNYWRKPADTEADIQVDKTEAEIETAPAVEKETSYFLGSKVEFTGEPEKDGFRPFVYIEGHRKGQSGVMMTDIPDLEPVTRDVIEDAEGSIDEALADLEEASGINEPDLDNIAKTYAELIRTEDPMVIRDIIGGRLDGKAKARRKRLTAAGMLDAKLQPTDKAVQMKALLDDAKGALAKDGRHIADVRLEPADAKPVKMPAHYDPKGIDDVDHTARNVAETFAGEERTRYALMAIHVTKNGLDATDGRVLIRIPGTPNDPTDRMEEKGTTDITEGQFPDVESCVPPMDKSDHVATIDVAKEARRAEGMRPSPLLEDIAASTVVKVTRPGRKHDVCLNLLYYQDIFKAVAKLGLKQLDVYSTSPTHAILFAEHGADSPVKIVFMPLTDESCHHYVVDFNATEAKPESEPKEEPVPIVDFHKAKAQMEKEKQEQPAPAPKADDDELSLEELQAIRKLATAMMAEGV